MRNGISKVCFPPPPNLSGTVCFTVDVEDYFMSPETIRFEDWESYTSCIHTGMERCLKILDDYNAKATFFFVGWLAERYPELVQWTVERGHEVGTHLYTHKYVSDMDESGFAESLKRSLDVIRSAAPSVEITGHRAPAFSLDREKGWQFDILSEHGIRYDSSIIPHRTYLYGDDTAPRFPYTIGNILEIPPAVIELGGKRYPVGGGGTLRILPQPYLAYARRRYLKDGYPAVLYMHPWEYVPEHPKPKLPFKLSLIHSMGLKSVERKVRAVLKRYRSVTMQEYFEELSKNQQIRSSE